MDTGGNMDEASMTEASEPSGDDFGRDARHPLHRLIGMAAEQAADGRATCEVHAMVGEDAPTSFALTTAVDILLVRAAATTVNPPEEMNGTAELNVTYTRTAVGTAQVEAHAVGRTPSMRVLEFSVSDADGTLAFGRGTYAVRSPR
jgi:acyl-coenzyme A thioesterase PaaI-like protein